MTITSTQSELRKGKIGASDVASALGHNPYKTKAQLYAQILGLVAPFEGSLATRVGEHMESLILHEINTQLVDPDKGERPFVNHGETVLHPTLEWLLCHPDGMRIGADGETELLEIKNVGPRATWNYERDGTPPIWVMDQCLAQAFVCKVKIVWVGSYHGGNDLRFKKLTFNQANFDELERGLKEFWYYVENEIIPPLGWQDSKSISELHPHPTVSQRNVFETKSRGIVKDYLEARKSKKQAERGLLELEAKMKLAMKETEELVDEDGRTIFSYRNEKRGSKTSRVLRCKIKESIDG